MISAKAINYEQIDHPEYGDRENAAAICNAEIFLHPRGRQVLVNEQNLTPRLSPPLSMWTANLGQDTIQPVQVQMLNGNYLNILANKIEELKQTSGNQDVQNGAAKRRRYGSERNRGVAGIGGGRSSKA